MDKTQRYKYEMFVRVRDYGMTQRELFPEASKAGQRFARVSAAVAAIDEHRKDHVLGSAEARKVKAATRAAVVDRMKTIALAARRVTEHDPDNTRFRMPRRRTLKGDIAAARLFIEEAGKRQEEFVGFGLPATFLSELQTKVDQLERAVNVRLSSKTVQSSARLGIEAALADGMKAVRDLDALVGIATRDDPTRLGTWRTARRIEGQSTAAEAPVLEPGSEVLKAS